MSYINFIAKKVYTHNTLVLNYSRSQYNFILLYFWSMIDWQLNLYIVKIFWDFVKDENLNLGNFSFLMNIKGGFLHKGDASCPSN